MVRILTLALTLAMLPAGLAAQQSTVDFYAHGPYRDGVPRPEAVLGYPIGELHTTYGRMERYFDALAAAQPDRIRLEPIGESYEKQRMRLAIISSEANLARVEEVRDALHRLADPRRTAPAEAALLAASTPTVVWLNYANDGNESAAFEAAMQVAYQLVAGEGEETRRFRDGAVVIINPAHNPESHERFVAWYNAFGIGAEDPLSLEHHGPWGMDNNNNHYQIDLNRDGLGMTQRETQAVAAAVLKWRPQVFVDHHGETTQMFFPPNALPVNPALPEQTSRWVDIFGRGNARAFDQYGWQYYVRDVFDLHYPGYWDSWPSFHGATGMTYETDGGGSKGLRWRRDDGTILTFRDGIMRHFTASLATVRTAVENREARLRDYHEFFRTALEEGRNGPVRAYVLDPAADPRRAAALAATLLRHGIEVSRATASFRAEAREHRTGEPVRREFPAGSYLIDLGQPNQRLAETLLAREVPIDPAFVQEQYARWSRNARRGESEAKEEYQFYDVTAWSLPLAFGVPAYALARPAPAAAEPIVVPDGALAGSGVWTDEIPFPLPDLRAGTAASVVAGEAVPAPEARTAYLFSPEPEGALRLVAGLMREEFNVAVALRPLVVGGREFPRGTFVVRVERNPGTVHERIDALARDAGVEVFGANTAFPEHGPTGVGGEDVVSLRRPRIAMIGDEGVRITSYGAAWFTLERRLGYPFTPLRFQQLRAADLDEFDVLALPHGSAGAYRDALGEEGLAKVKAWIERGGTLVAWGGGAAFAARTGWASTGLVDGSEADSAASRAALDAIDALVESPGPRPPALSPSAQPDAVQPVPGAIARASLDLGHWLTIGFTDPLLPTLVQGDAFLELSEKGANVVVFPTEGELRISGFVWPGNTQRHLAGSAYTIAEPLGNGQVVLFAGDPGFRLVWRNTSRLLGNALLLGATLR